LSKKESVGLKRTDRKLGRRLQIISTQRPAGGQQQPDVSGGHDKETFARWVWVLLLSQFRSGRANLLSGSPKRALETAIGFLGQGMQNVSIVDETGRVFSIQEFSLSDDD
jgi:hypothetical protein